jgi:molecular chaperone GrpE
MTAENKNVEQEDELESDTLDQVEGELVDEEVELVEETSEEDLFSKIDELKEAKAQAEDKLIRSHAEMENLRRRHQKELENAHKYSVEKFANELLAVIDSLEMGLQAANQDDADIEKIKEGSKLTLKMFTQMFEKFDIEMVNPEGEKFDPDFHQAMAMQPTKGFKPNMVVAVMQKGYKIAGRLLRPAMVMVSK